MRNGQEEEARGEEARLQARKELIAGVYSRAAPGYGRVGPNFFAHFGRRLVELAQVSPGERVLDIASGRGAVLFAAAERVGTQASVIGIDLAEGMVRETAADIRGRAISNAHLCQMDAERLGFAEASFECALCNFAVFFFPQRARALAEFLRVLRPAGKLGLTLSVKRDNQWDWYGQLLDKYRAAINLHFQSEPDDIRIALSESGFTDIQVVDEEGEFVFADPEEWWNSQWTHGPRVNLERMTPEVLQKVRAEASAQLEKMRQPDGIHYSIRMLFFLARKPA